MSEIIQAINLHVWDEEFLHFMMGDKQDFKTKKENGAEISPVPHPDASLNIIPGR